MRDRREGNLFPLLGVLLVSGFAAMGVEVVWARMLHRVLGSTSLAVATIVAGFLGGLGAGAWIAERFFGSTGRPLRAYAGAELAAVASTVTFSMLLPAATAVLALPGGEVLVLAAVVLAALPWGAAFPPAMRAVERTGAGRSPGDLLRRVRAAYGINAIGSACGGLVVGLILVPAGGETAAIAVCAACGTAACTGALALAHWAGKLTGPAPADPAAKRNPEAAARPGAEEPPPAGAAAGRPAGTPPSPAAKPAAAAPSSRSAVWLFLFVCGLAVIYWEVLWTRILVLVVGATVYSFAIIAAAVVLGIGAGSLAAGGRRLEKQAGWILPSVAVVLLAAGYAAVPHLCEAYLWGVRTLGAPPLLAGAAGAGIVVLVPNAVLGCLFPWVLAPRIEAAGRCYAVNCAGSMLGAFAAGPLAAASVGLEDAYRSGLVLLVLAAVLGAFVAGVRRWRIALGAGIALAAGLVLVPAGPLGRPWNPKHLLSGVYQWSREDLENLPLQEAARSREILARFAGREVIVTVERDRDANTVYFRGNGKVEGSVPIDPDRPGLADVPTQVILGAAGKWFAGERPAGGTLLIGLGSGVTLGGILEDTPAPASAGGKDGPGGGRAPGLVDVIEIEEAFLQAVRSPQAQPYLEPFLPAGVLQEDRVHFHFGDARRLLAVELRNRKWSVVVSQPSEPWIAGSAPLFTREFFELASRRLRAGGIFVQWLQLYKLDADSVRLCVRTFRRVFPEVFLLRPPATGELILLGSLEKLEWTRALAAAVERGERAAGIQIAADRAALVLLGPRAVDEWVGLAPYLPVNTDSRGTLAYRAARCLYAPRELASKNLAALRERGGRDPVTAYLPPSVASDAAFRRLLARRNLRVGDLPEAAAILHGDPSPEARDLRARIQRKAHAR